MGKIKCTLMDYEVQKGEFNCENSSIENRICSAYYSTLLRQTYGYKICVGEIVVGYFMIYLKKILTNTMEKIDGDEYSAGITDGYMSVHIEYIAVGKKYKNNKIGTYVLKGIISSVLSISRNVPIRLITLDALKEYHEWYKAIGFRDIPGESNMGEIYPMYMDCMSEQEREKLNDYCYGAI